jgi:uncharacterized protein (TIGR01732 family)
VEHMKQGPYEMPGKGYEMPGKGYEMPDQGYGMPTSEYQAPMMYSQMPMGYCCGTPSYGKGSNFSIFVVLFILLIIIGAACMK